MRINNIFSEPQAGVKEAGSSVQGASRTSEPAGSQTSDASVHTPAPELAQWVSLVRQAPDTRADAIQKAAARVASGEYLTPSSAQKVAQAIMDSPNM
jgi:DNA-binding transcriptional regulator YdaS (Cro superfamily)